MIDEYKLFDVLSAIIESYAPWEHQQRVRCRELLAELKAAKKEDRESACYPASAWHEDDGPALWWNFPIDEPPYAGTPLDDSFPVYKTHWTRIQIPKPPAA